jgi:hypothetical protein
MRAELDKQQGELEVQRANLEAAITSYAASTEEYMGAVAAEVTDTVKDKAVEAHAEVRKALDNVAKQIGVDPGELTLSKAREHASSFRAWRKQLSWKAFATGLAFVLIALAGAIAAAWYKEKLVALVAAAAPVIAVLTRVIQIGRPIAKAAQEANEIGKRVTLQLARTNPKIFQDQQELDAKQAALTAERARLDKRADELRAALSEAKKPGMREYVLERASHYRDKLGIVASVHRDFQNLSDQLRDDKTDPKLQRIILYIDDLDRCSPRRVVEMLQAIHLLLSFELFVVVVAVDPKWLLRSLEAYYARQFQSSPTTGAQDWESRPQFYLEKIFQIPYALQPMNAARFDRMVATLLKSATAVDVGDRQRPNGDGAPAAAPGADAGTAAAASLAAPSEASESPRLDLMPRNLEITRAELVHLRTLGPLVTSPRSAKRLANLYRIVRAGLDGDALDEFVDDRFQLTQMALAAVVGCPDVACPWFKAILSRSSGDPAAVVAPLEAMAAGDPRARFLCDRVRACGEIAAWDHVVEVCSRASRYSFETGALLGLVPS